MSLDKIFKLEVGDCIKVLKGYPDNYFHSIVTDPPYNISIATKTSQEGWDSFKSNRHFQKWCEQWAKECYRVLKPGGHLIAFSSQRTCHRLACAIEDSGFVPKDIINWVYFSGMPKGKRSKDKLKASVLKPATEPAVLAMKPIKEKTLEAQYKKTNTGYLFIDECRLQHDSYHLLGPNGDDFTKAWTDRVVYSNFTKNGKYTVANKDENYHPIDLSDYTPTKGRYPSNVFACKKANMKEKDAGIRKSSSNENSRRNFHPSVKPLKLMKWLVRLVTPPQGKVLDPFLGSGTTALACILQDYKCVGIERNKEYAKIIKDRTKAAYKAKQNKDESEYNSEEDK